MGEQMREAEFREWLQGQGYDSRTVTTQIARAKRLDQAYGDLDLLHPDNGLFQLQQELTYSKDDERAGNPNPARFAIDGNIYNSLASYRKTLDYYRQFADSGLDTPQRNEQAEALTRLGQAEIETAMNDCDAVGVDAFLRAYDYVRPTNWVLRPANGEHYPAKATVAIALGKLPEARALRASEFFGGYGEQQAYRRLHELGYEIVSNGGAAQAARGITRDAVEAALNEFDALGQAAFLAKYERGIQGTRYWLKRGTVTYPSKAIANAAYEQMHGARGAYGGTEARKQLARLGYGIVDKDGRTLGTAEAVVSSPMSLAAPTNLILYGPPGTGKTYATATEAVRLCDGTAPSDRDDLMVRYEELRDEKRIGFVTFHQSYDYETFVEGLRPETSDQDSNAAGFRLEPKPGIFREISAVAEQARSRPTSSAATIDGDLSGKRFWKMGQGAIGTEDDVYEAAVAGGYITLGWGGAIDWSASHFATTDAIRTEWIRQNPEDSTPSHWTQTHVFRSEMQTGDIVIVPNGNSAFRAVAEVVGDYYFEPSAEGYYAHRRKVNWLLVLDEPLPLDTIVEGNFTMRTLYSLATKRVNLAALGRLLSSESEVIAVESAAAPDQFVLIIDEINRANVSKVFGELITLIEPDKRLGMPNAISLRLPYSKRDFGVPANLHIIGTMNTADRSIALLDTALRRRFQFREVAPDPSRLPEQVEGVPLRQVLEAINDRIEYLVDRDHRIGHAFFIGSGGDSRTAIDSTMRDKVIPLLQEYFFDDWSRLAAVLGEVPDKGGAFLECRMLTDPTGLGGEARPSWRVREEFAPDAYDRLIGKGRLP